MQCFVASISDPPHARGQILPAVLHPRTTKSAGCRSVMRATREILPLEYLFWPATGQAVRHIRRQPRSVRADHSHPMRSKMKRIRITPPLRTDATGRLCLERSSISSRKCRIQALNGPCRRHRQDAQIVWTLHLLWSRRAGMSISSTSARPFTRRSMTPHHPAGTSRQGVALAAAFHACRTWIAPVAFGSRRSSVLRFTAAVPRPERARADNRNHDRHRASVRRIIGTDESAGGTALKVVPTHTNCRRKFSSIPKLLEPIDIASSTTARIVHIGRKIREQLWCPALLGLQTGKPSGPAPQEWSAHRDGFHIIGLWLGQPYSPAPARNGGLPCAACLFCLQGFPAAPFPRRKI